MTDTYQQVKNHLEFLGYAVEEKGLPRENETHEQRINFFAKSNGSKTNLFVTYTSSAGFSFVTSFVTKPTIANNEFDFLNTLNKMTAESYLISFVSSKDFKNVFLLAWYPDYYDKKTFVNFLERLEGDIKFAITNNPQILHYIQ
jgi:hypothetical protein